MPHWLELCIDGRLIIHDLPLCIYTPDPSQKPLAFWVLCVNLKIFVYKNVKYGVRIAKLVLLFRDRQDPTQGSHGYKQLCVLSLYMYVEDMLVTLSVFCSLSGICLFDTFFVSIINFIYKLLKKSRVLERTEDNTLFIRYTNKRWNYKVVLILREVFTHKLIIQT